MTGKRQSRLPGGAPPLPARSAKTPPPLPSGRPHPPRAASCPLQCKDSDSFIDFRCIEDKTRRNYSPVNHIPPGVLAPVTLRSVLPHHLVVAAHQAKKKRRDASCSKEKRRQRQQQRRSQSQGRGCDSRARENIYQPACRHRTTPSSPIRFERDNQQQEHQHQHQQSLKSAIRSKLSRLFHRGAAAAAAAAKPPSGAATATAIDNRDSERVDEEEKAVETTTKSKEVEHSSCLDSNNNAGVAEPAWRPPAAAGPKRPPHRRDLSLDASSRRRPPEPPSSASNSPARRPPRKPTAATATTASSTRQHRVVTAAAAPPALPPRSAKAAAGSLALSFLENLAQLKRKPWYFGPLSMNDAEEMLQRRPDGTFLVRDSAHDSYIVSLSFRARGQTYHTRIEHNKGKFSFWSQPENYSANTIVEFIESAMEYSKTGNFHYFLSSSTAGTPPIQVSMLYPLSRFSAMTSLQHRCRYEILARTRRDHIDCLPLPKSLQHYLQEKQYFIESKEDFLLDGAELAKSV